MEAILQDFNETWRKGYSGLKEKEKYLLSMKWMIPSKAPDIAGGQGVWMLRKETA